VKALFWNIQVFGQEKISGCKGDFIAGFIAHVVNKNGIDILGIVEVNTTAAEAVTAMVLKALQAKDGKWTGEFSPTRLGTLSGHENVESVALFVKGDCPKLQLPKCDYLGFTSSSANGHKGRNAVFADFHQYVIALHHSPPTKVAAVQSLAAYVMSLALWEQREPCAHVAECEAVVDTAPKDEPLQHTRSKGPVARVSPGSAPRIPPGERKTVIEGNKAIARTKSKEAYHRANVLDDNHTPLKTAVVAYADFNLTPQEIVGYKFLGKFGLTIATSESSVLKSSLLVSSGNPDGVSTSQFLANDKFIDSVMHSGVQLTATTVVDTIGLLKDFMQNSVWAGQNASALLLELSKQESPVSSSNGMPPRQSDVPLAVVTKCEEVADDDGSVPAPASLNATDGELLKTGICEASIDNSARTAWVSKLNNMFLFHRRYVSDHLPIMVEFTAGN
jgi:hypothetical protein